VFAREKREKLRRYVREERGNWYATLWAGAPFSVLDTRDRRKRERQLQGGGKKKGKSTPGQGWESTLKTEKNPEKSEFAKRIKILVSTSGNPHRIKREEGKKVRPRTHF